MMTEEMGVEEASAFISDHPHVYLLARRGDGYPTGYGMMARVSQPGTVDFTTYRASAKARNLLRDGVGAVLARATDPSDGRVVWAEGSVVEVEGAGWDTEQPAASDAGRGVPAEIAQKVAARHDDGKRMVLRLVLSHALLMLENGK